MMTTTSSKHQHTALPVRRFDLSIPLKRFNGQVSPDTEDTDLTEFVQAHLAGVFSLSEDPPACGHCGDRHTRLRRAARPGKVRLPAFLCLAHAGRAGFAPVHRAPRHAGLPLATASASCC